MIQSKYISESIQRPKFKEVHRCGNDQVHTNGILYSFY